MRKSVCDTTFVNQSFATDDKRKKNTTLGRNYWNIDFEIENNFKLSYTEKQPIIGYLHIGKNRLPLTGSECKKVLNTLEEALKHYNILVRNGRIRKK